jgi:hypothetical protein
MTEPAASQGIRDARALAVAHPYPGSVYRIDPALPRSAQRIVVSAQLGVGIRFAGVDLLVDGSRIAHLTSPPYEALWTLAPGAHTIVARGVGAGGTETVSDAVQIEVWE